MKRQVPSWPKEIVEVPSDRVDPRADPAATQRISRALLEDALQRTKSGTRPALRTDPRGREEADGNEPFFGPRDSYVDDSPRVTFGGAERMDAAAKALAPPAGRETPRAPWPVAHPPSALQPLLPQVAPPQAPMGKRVLALVVVSLVAFFAAAATIGFVAGRLTHH